MNNKNRSMQVVALLTVAVLALGTMPFAAAGDDSRVKLEGEFTNIDDGKAKYESRDNGDRKKFSVEIDNVTPNVDFEIDVDGTIFNTTSNEFGNT